MTLLFTFTQNTHAVRAEPQNITQQTNPHPRTDNNRPLILLVVPTTVRVAAVRVHIVLDIALLVYVVSLENGCLAGAFLGVWGAKTKIKLQPLGSDN